jgi:hypothetical protein
MFLLYRQVGELQPEHLEFLTSELEEEWPDDRDYFINRAMVQLLQARGADAALIQLLEDALGERDEVDILWLDTDAQDDSMYIDLDQENWDHEHVYGPAGELFHEDGTPPHPAPNPQRPDEWTNATSNRPDLDAKRREAE